MCSKYIFIENLFKIFAIFSVCLFFFEVDVSHYCTWTLMEENMVMLSIVFLIIFNPKKLGFRTLSFYRRRMETDLHKNLIKKPNCFLLECLNIDFNKNENSCVGGWQYI